MTTAGWLVVVGCVGFVSYFVGGMMPDRTSANSLTYRGSGCVWPVVCFALVVAGFALGLAP